MKRAVKYIFCFLAVFIISSCLSTLKFPGQYVYSVKVSDDMLKLFEIEAVYTAADGTDTHVPVSQTKWAKTIIKTEVSDGFDPQMSVSMKAKAAARNGSALTKDSYEMGLEYCIGESKSMSTDNINVIAKADEGEKISMTFKVKIPEDVNPDDITIEMPHLKYDKHFAFCFRVDDSYVNGWSKLYQTINGRWVDNIEFFHFGMSKTKGYQQAFPLCSTDGCGNDRRFTFGEAIWPTWWNEYSPSGFIEDEITSDSNPYISWKELGIMTDMGNAVYWHNVDERTYSKESSDEIVTGLQKDYEKTLSKIGFPLKILAQPDGNSNYLTAGQDSPLVCAVSATIDDSPYKLNSGDSFYKKNIFGGGTNQTVEEKMKELASESASDNPILLGMLVHRCDEEYLDMFRTIHSLYGKGGKDNIWVTTYDELFEYVERRRSVNFSSTVEDGYKIFTATFPKVDRFIYDEMSFIIRGTKNLAVPVSKNIVGFSTAVWKNGMVLVNCNVSSSLITKIDKYISLYHEMNMEEYYLDAKYLISLLREDMREEYTQKLENKPVDPDKRDLELNGTYTKKEIKWYIEQYDGKTFICTKL